MHECCSIVSKKKRKKVVTNKTLVKLCYSPSKEYYATIKNYNYKDHTAICKCL